MFTAEQYPAKTIEFQIGEDSNGANEVREL
jgi:hypothetical protein